MNNPTATDDDFLTNIQPEIELDNNNNNKKEPSSVGRCSNSKKLKDRPNVKGGYRPVLVNDLSCLKKESNELETKFQHYFSQINMNEKDMVSFYMLNYLAQRYPNQLLQNKCQIITDVNLIEKVESLSYLNLIEFKNKSVVSRLNRSKNIKTLFDLVNTFNLHSVPHSARFVLVNWYLNKIDLKLFVNKIPTSVDVLRMQSQAQRCISLIYQNIDKLIMNERDALSFLLHDLVHAYKMFSNDYLLKGQIGFSKCMLNIIDDQMGYERLSDLCESDETFSNEFDYLISDMNSHPKHLMHYFKAILINSFKRKHQIDANSCLEGESLNEFNQLFELFLNLFKMNEKEKQICRSILNEKIDFYDKDSIQPFNIVDFTLLDNYFLKLSYEINKNN